MRCRTIILSSLVILNKLTKAPNSNCCGFLNICCQGVTKIFKKIFPRKYGGALYKGMLVLREILAMIDILTSRTNA